MAWRSALLATILVAGLTSCSPVTQLTPGHYEDLTSRSLTESTDSPLWFVRFVVPWEDDEQGKAVFRDLAEQIPVEVARFGEFPVDSVEAMTMADGLGILEFPSIRVVGARLARPDVPRGAPQTSRPLFFDNQYQGPLNDLNKLKDFVLQSVPNRFKDPVSNALIPTVTKVSSMKQIHAAVERVGDSPVLLFFSKVSTDSLLQLATIHSQAARLQTRALVLLSSDVPLSREFEATMGSPETGLTLVHLAKDGHGDLKKTGDEVTELSTPNAIAAAMHKAARPFDRYSVSIQSTLANWRSDMAQFVDDSPLRKIESVEQFNRDILATKHAVIVVFLLRQSDDLFDAQLRTAVQVATFAREKQHISLTTGEPVSLQIRPDVFWIDAEVHPDLAKALQATKVPSLGFILHMQNDLKGLKYFPDGKEFPSADKINKFLQSERLLETKDVRLLDVSSVTFSTKIPFPKTKQNNQYLGIDLLNYQTDVEAPTILLDVINAAKEEENELKSGSKKKSKLSPKQEKKKKEREEKERERIKAELGRKKQEKEERMRRKAEEDAQRAEEEAERAKNAPKEPKKKKKVKAKVQPKKQVKRKVKPPKDLMEELTRWDKESKKAADRFVKSDSVTGRLTIVDSLSP